MVTLDRSAFSEVIRLIALRIRAQQCSTFMKRLNGHILARPKVRPIIPDEAEGGSAQTRLLLLAETVLDTELRGLPEELRAFVLEEGAVPLAHERMLGYDLLTVEQVLRRLLPQGMEVPSAFEQVGHVAHVNLREEQLPYKAVIGQVLLDKNARLRSVVNKVESISNELRVFPMELLAGEPSLVTKVRENGATFELDYREVYWNSRLEREHWRVVEQVGEGEVLCDMMAGIGPFALPAALRGSKVYANDLNPHSAHWLRRNVVANKVPRSVQCYNLCGRAFIRLLLAPPPAAAAAAGRVPAATAPVATAASSAAAAASAPALGAADTPNSTVTAAAASSAAATAASAGSADGYCTTPGLGFGVFQHVVMNLPATALDFLDVFIGAFARQRWQAAAPRTAHRTRRPAHLPTSSTPFAPSHPPPPSATCAPRLAPTCAHPPPHPPTAASSRRPLHRPLHLAGAAAARALSLLLQGRGPGGGRHRPGRGHPGLPTAGRHRAHRARRLAAQADDVRLLPAARRRVLGRRRRGRGRKRSERKRLEAPAVGMRSRRARGVWLARSRPSAPHPHAQGICQRS